MSSLFDLTVPEAREHPNFRALRCSPFHDSAKKLASELYQRMGDPNGGFLGDFQSDGFHSRLFELASFAYLEEAGALVDRQHEAPDFLADLDGYKVAMEVTTANPPAGQDRDISIARLEKISSEEDHNQAIVEFPLRIASSIRKKLRKRYHKLPHCRCRSLIFVVAPYYQPGSVYYPDDSLLGHIYGFRVPGLPDPPKTPIFAGPESAPLSAIMFCNQFTVPRFLRIAHLAPQSGVLFGERSGFCLLEDGDDGFVMTQYHHRLDDGTAPRENWSQGVTLYHNPHASHPIPRDLLPSTSYFHVVGGGLRRELNGFHPVTSFMMNWRDLSQAETPNDNA